MNISEMTVALTGATGGIGKAIASELMAKGAHLVLIGRNADKLAALTKELAADANSVTCVAADIATSEGRAKVISAFNAMVLPPNVLVNNAGSNDFALYEDQSEQTVTELININTVAPMLLVKQYLQLVSEKNIHCAQVINVGSAFGSIGHPGYSAYCASKFALRGFTETLSRELSDTDISIKYFAPRATRTGINSPAVEEMNQQLKVAMDTPEQVAGEFTALLCGTRREKYVGWPEKLLVKLNQVLPGIVDSALAKNLPLIRRYASQPNH